MNSYQKTFVEARIWFQVGCQLCPSFQLFLSTTSRQHGIQIDLCALFGFIPEEVVVCSQPLFPLKVMSHFFLNCFHQQLPL